MPDENPPIPPPNQPPDDPGAPGSHSAPLGPERAFVTPGRKSGSERDLIEEALNEAESSARPADLPPADAFKGYEVLGEIHRGGQGVVYQALQLATKRRVAIKVLHAGPFVGSSGRARFEREVQVLGQLSHPHIVKIHDSGVTDTGSCYYVMDYISGSTLDEFITRDPKPDIKATLNIFAKICDAVGYAHLRGIIHRDLKPSNIRVDRSGEPIVVDFGLAKVALGDVSTKADEPHVMTMTGEFIGSLPWASPEQAEGSAAAIDVRTDVYSLGVILYQLLTGRFPYTVIGNMRDVLDNILRQEPARPSTVRRQVNDEVETIVLKCLAKDRDRRYQSGAELARDVKRYLAGEPIEAKRDSVSYMLRKAVRKHKAAAATILVGLLAIIVFGVSMWLAWREASAQRARAEANLATVRGIARTMIVEINDQIDDLRGATPARQALLTKAQELLKGLEAQSPTDPALRRELADAHLRVAEIHAGLYAPRVGTTDDADQHLADAKTIIDALAADDPQHPDTVELQARHLAAVASQAHQRREFQPAADGFDASARAYDRLLASGRVGDPARVVALRDRRMGVRGRFADALLELTPPDPAERARLADQVAALYDEQEQYWQQRADASPTDLTAQQSLYIVLDKRARAAVAGAMRLGADASSPPERIAEAAALLAQARPLAERAREGFDRLRAQRPQSVDFERDLYLADYFLGRTYLDEAALRARLPADHARALDPQGVADYRASALRHFERALSTTERMFAADESNLQAQRDVALCLNQVGNTLRDMARYAESVVAFERGLSIRRDIARSDPSPRHRLDLGRGLFKRAEVEELAARAAPEGERRPRLQNAERLAVEALGVFQALVQEQRLGAEAPEMAGTNALLTSIRRGP